MREDSKIPNNRIITETSPSIPKEEIDLLEYIRTLTNSWKIILVVTILFTVLSIFYALYLPEVYKAETLLAPVQEEQSGGSSTIGQFGGLAAMAGITIPSNSNVERVFATLKSRVFLKNYISNKGLLPVLFDKLWDESTSSWKLADNQIEPTLNDGFFLIEGAIDIDKDTESGLITLSLSWTNPEVLAGWTNDLVKELNERLRQKAITVSKKKVGYLEQELAKTTLKDMRNVLYSLLESEKQKAMLANVNEDFALEVIDPAVTPIFRVKPNRKLIVILGGICGIFIAMFSILFFDLIKKIRYSNKQKNSS